MIKKIWKHMRSDWVRVFMALILACLIYLMRSDFNKNIISRDIDNIPVIIEILSSDIINLGSSAHTTSITVQGSKDKINELTSDQIKIILPISQNDIGKGLINLTPDNIKTPYGIKVIRIHNPGITVNLEQMDNKKVPVAITFDSLKKLSANYSVSKAVPFPREVTISGPRSKLKDIKSVTTLGIPLDSSVQNSFKYTAKISLPEDITVEPAQVTCEIEIIQNFITRSMKLPVALLTAPANKTNLKFKLHPKEAEVKISGPSRIVHFLTAKDLYVFVNTENITAPGEYTQKIHILPTSSAVRISAVSPSQITVTAQRP